MTRIHRRTVKKKKKSLDDEDIHDGMVTHLEPDILECEGKQVLGNIVPVKLVEVMEFQLSSSKY